MAHFYESTLIDTVDGFQCKSYANEHPDGYIIVKPKYIPRGIISGKGLKYRYLFEKCMVRFNQFAAKEQLTENVDLFRKKYPSYIFDSPIHHNWFYVVPVDRISCIHDPKAGLQELLAVPEADMDQYLKLVKKLVGILSKSGVSSSSMGITHSTLLGNYTYGRSDIDIIIYGKSNGWRIMRYLEQDQSGVLKWKTKAEWARYYEEHKTSESSHFTVNEYVMHMMRKKYEGMIEGTVFTLFTVEDPDETWFKWGEEEYIPLGLATISGIVIDHHNSHVRPGFYEVGNFRFLDTGNIVIDKGIPFRRVVTYSIPFVQQAVTGERIKACGLLELVKSKLGEQYYRIVIGYSDAYLCDRREREYLKTEGI